MNFNPVAGSYRWLERLAFGGALQLCRTGLLEHVADAQNILILGEGDGRFLQMLLDQNASAKVTVVDSSSRMIALARGRVPGNERVVFHCADIRQLKLPEQTFDLIVTHFFLDCFEEGVAREIVRQLCDRLDVGGRWLWSDFAVPASGRMRVPAKVIVWVLYQFFRLTTDVEARRLVNAERIFEEAGLEKESERSFLNGLLRSELWRRRVCPAERKGVNLSTQVHLDNGVAKERRQGMERDAGMNPACSIWQGIAK